LPGVLLIVGGVAWSAFIIWWEATRDDRERLKLSVKMLVCGTDPECLPGLDITWGLPVVLPKLGWGAFRDPDHEQWPSTVPRAPRELLNERAVSAAVGELSVTS